MFSICGLNMYARLDDRVIQLQYNYQDLPRISTFLTHSGFTPYPPATIFILLSVFVEGGPRKVNSSTG